MTTSPHVFLVNHSSHQGKLGVETFMWDGLQITSLDRKGHRWCLITACSFVKVCDQQMINKIGPVRVRGLPLHLVTPTILCPQPASPRRRLFTVVMDQAGHLSAYIDPILRTPGFFSLTQRSIIPWALYRGIGDQR